LAPRLVILNFTQQSTVSPHEVPELEVGERPPSMLRNVDGGPPGGAGARGQGAPTINAKKHQRWAPGRCWRQVRQRPPPKLKTLMVGPLGVLAACSAAGTTEVEDVDGRPPRG
jgi:hypothetical protein